MKKVKNENQKTFLDLTRNLWFTDGQQIKVGENLSEIMSGKSKVFEIKEVFFGDNFQTWKIIVTVDG